MTNITYAIIASCMKNNGAWAKTQQTFRDDNAARLAFNVAGWPVGASGCGREWSRTLTLIERNGSDRTKLAERSLN